MLNLQNLHLPSLVMGEGGSSLFSAARDATANFVATVFLSTAGARELAYDAL